MSLLSGLKEGLYQRKLKQCSKIDKERSSCNFESARSIGIIFNASSENDTKIALGYKRELQRQHKKVRIVGFKDAKELTGNETYPCFCNKDLALNQTPKKQEILDFIQEPFDLLLALHIGDCQPLEYIAAASSARFRIGHYREDKTDFYDFMIYGKNKSLRALIYQMENYLKKIH